jgi:hypothetical protein
MYYSDVLDEDVFSSAVKGGDMDLLKWLRQRSWNSRCLKTALEEKQHDIVRSLNEQQCPHDEETSKLLMQEFIKLYEEQKAE